MDFLRASVRSTFVVPFELPIPDYLWNPHRWASPASAVGCRSFSFSPIGATPAWRTISRSASTVQRISPSHECFRSLEQRRRNSGSCVALSAHTRGSDGSRQMKVLLTGATGLIGGEIAGRLVDLGHEVVAVSRRSEARRSLGTQTVCLDFRSAILTDWLSNLADVGAVINCVGVLQGNGLDSPEAAHARGPAVLFEACEAAGVRRVIHFSAVGVNRGARSSFSASKAVGDADLQVRDLDWVILRPSVVLGRPVYGASALFRGLASLPLLPGTPGAGLLQVVQLEDVVETVVRLLTDPRPTQIALELVGPERLSFDEVVSHYRRWYGWAPARHFQIPAALFRPLYRLGDLIAGLGWRPPVRSNARREIERGAVGDPEPWQRATGIVPQRLGDALAASPPSVQDRWFARMFLLKPVVFASFSAFWIATGLISIGPGWGQGVELMRSAGAGAWSAPAVVAGAIVDITIGVGTAIRALARPALFAALGVSLFYALAGTLLLPALWSDPLGALLKIAPILALNLVAFAILEDR
jgi:uncharacterized protein YbjT (DUF2867 family)